MRVCGWYLLCTRLFKLNISIFIGNNSEFHSLKIVLNFSKCTHLILYSLRFNLLSISSNPESHLFAFSFFTAKTRVSQKISEKKYGKSNRFIHHKFKCFKEIFKMFALHLFIVQNWLQNVFWMKLLTLRP